MWSKSNLKKAISAVVRLMLAGATATTLLVAPSVLHAASANDGKVSRPNLVYILADDLGYGDVGCCNPDGKIPTPNLDHLAREGMLFTDAHTSSSVCTPTRYGILTGRYCWRTSKKNGVLQGHSSHLISLGRETVASLLKRQGYSTACVGKWHLGMDWATSRPVKEGAPRKSVAAKRSPQMTDVLGEFVPDHPLPNP